MKWFVSLLTIVTLSACAASGPQPGNSTEIAALAKTLQELSPNVDPDEAMRAAMLTYETTQSLAIAYQITDSPLIHNAKVNAGRKPRGLCYHWAEDLQAQLDAAGFETLDTARAIANSDSWVLIDHSTAVITAKGAAMESGIVVDPWRYGGSLFWAPVHEDTRYDWRLREDVLREKGRITYVQRTEGSLAAPPAD
ncbi:MAG: hypothetical protein ABJL67_11820 [Sulfitobacter sp.]